MTMVQTTNEINPRNALHLEDALEEISFIHDLCQLLHFSTEGMDKPRQAALRAGIGAVGLRLDCVAESIKWAREEAA